MANAIEIKKQSDIFSISAPSNIALIKYMGLANTQEKIPANTSFSYTLEHARTFITISQAENDEILVPIGHERFYNFIQKLKKKLVININLRIESYNNFPTACGIASSAASFAAITAGMAALARKAIDNDVISFSRFGSGSACRSFYKGFVEWHQDIVEPMNLPLKELHHAAILISKSPKSVSSSQAHELVKTSPLFKDRIINAELRLKLLKQSITRNNWIESAEIIKEEYQEMHALFNSAKPNFNYRTKDCLEIEDWCNSFYKLHGFGPWVTLDAGPNIHLLFRNIIEKEHFLREFREHYAFIEVFQ